MTRLRINKAFYENYAAKSRKRLLEDVQASFEEQSKKMGITQKDRDRVYNFAVRATILLDPISEKEREFAERTLKLNRSKTNLFKRKFADENVAFFMFIVDFRNFFQNFLVNSKISFCFISFFFFFFLEYIWHYYPPFEDIHFDITFEDIIKNIPPFF